MLLRTGSHVRCSVSQVLSAARSVIAFSLNSILCTPLPFYSHTALQPWLLFPSGQEETEARKGRVLWWSQPVRGKT